MEAEFPLEEELEDEDLEDDEELEEDVEDEELEEDEEDELADDELDSVPPHPKRKLVSNAIVNERLFLFNMK